MKQIKFPLIDLSNPGCHNFNSHITYPSTISLFHSLDCKSFFFPIYIGLTISCINPGDSFHHSQRCNVE